MVFPFFCKVYINVGKDFYDALGDAEIPNFEHLINEVALHKKIDDKGIILAEKIGSKLFIYRGRTIRYIVREVNRFINNIIEIPSEENMASFTSKRQINRLVRAFQNKQGYISGYSLVIMHIMYTIIKNNPGDAEADYTLFQKCANFMHVIINKYYEQYNSDELANFLLNCYPVISDELINQNITKHVEDFPAIPKRISSNILDE